MNILPLEQLMAVEVRGGCGSLGDAVIDRLISWDVDLIASDARHAERNTLQLEYGKSVIHSQGEGFSISFDGSRADLMIGTHILVYDLIPSRMGPEVNRDLLDWFSAMQNAESIDSDYPIRWWVGEADVADAIARIARAKRIVEGVEICGRREWKSSDAISEVEMLWKRTAQGLTGEFDPTSLQLQTVPGIVVEGNRADRPDLAKLHDILVSIDGEGWRPLTPFRSAMMLLIADLFTE